MESDSRDKFESDNLIWQLEITLTKLSAICTKNAKLVDYINKKVDKTFSEYKNQKDNFKKLTWAEMDDSDLDLDLDITLPSPLSIITPDAITTNGEEDNNVITPIITPRDKGDNENENINDNRTQYEGIEPEQSISKIDDNIANPDGFSGDENIIAIIKEGDTNIKKKKPAAEIIKKKNPQIDPISSTYFVEKNNNTNTLSRNSKKMKKKSSKKSGGKSSTKNSDKWSTVTHSKNSKKKTEKIKGKLMFVQQKLLRRKKKMEETEANEHKKAEKKKEEQRLRMKRAEKRKLEQQKMLKQKNKKLTHKLKEIKLNNNMQKTNMVNAMAQRQIKAEKKKEKIKNNKKKQNINLNKKLKILERLNEKETKQMEENLNKRLNAANKRHQNNLIRRNSLSLSNSNQNNDYDIDINGGMGMAMNEEIEIENINKYIDIISMKRLSGKFLYIPRIVRKSSVSSSDLYYSIENLYNNTTPAAGDKDNDDCDVIHVLKTWIKNTNNINFMNSKYNKDVLLVINRLICFDINKLNIKSAKLLIKILILLCKNKIGLQLLAFKYAFKLLMYYKYCLDEYFFKHNEIYKNVLPQLAILIVRIFQSNNDYINKEYKNDKDYKKFKKQTETFLLLNLYKSMVLIKIGLIFKNKMIKFENNQRIIDGILNILIEIPFINGNNNINNLINDQIESVNGLEIIYFMENILKTNIKNNMNKKLLSIISKCFQFGINCINCMKILLINGGNDEEIFHNILNNLFQFICHDSNFNTNYDYILEFTNNMFTFLTLLSLNNKQIQNIFDKNLINKLCKNIPFYFILKPNGQNIFFPFLISISFNNKNNLNIIKLSLNIKHLQTWLKKNIFVYKKHNNKNNHKNNIKHDIKIPSKMWSNCLQFYNV